MATYDFVDRPAPVAGDMQMYNKTIRIDVTDTNIIPAGGASTSDVIEALKLGPNTMIHDLKVKIVTAEGGSETVDIKVGATTLMSNVDVTAAAGTITSYIVTSSGVGHFLSTADTIDISFDADCDALILDLTVVYFKTSYKD